MKKYMYILAFGLFAISALDLNRKNIEFLLFLSSAFGAVALAEMPIAWDRKIEVRKIVATLSRERYSISIIGKFCGFISIISLIAYFSLLFSGVKI